MQKDNDSGQPVDPGKDHPLFQNNNIFRRASGNREIPPELVAVGMDATKQAFVVGFSVGLGVLLAFLIGLFFLDINPIYISTIFASIISLVISGLAFFFERWSISIYFLVINPFVAIVAMSVGYRDVSGFFISALSIFAFASYVYLPPRAHLLNTVLIVLFSLFQYLGGPEALLGPAVYVQSITEKLVLTIVWLVAFLGTIQVSQVRNLNDFKEVIDLTIELDQIKASLENANHALDQSNAQLEQRVQDRTVALERALAQARAANDAKDRFLATMSHELRTPLNAIIGYSELIPDIVEDDLFDEYNRQEIKMVSSNITEAGNSLLALINDVLDISAIESGKITLEKRFVDLPSLIEKIIRMVTPPIEQNQNRLVVENHTAIKEFWSDPKLLQQILINLLGNAAKFTEFGVINLRVEQPNESWLRFEVIDTGIGIPNEKLDLIFEPFAQIEDSYTRRFSGTGLGLAITQHIIHALDGRIGVESELGMGSRFWFEIPSQ